MWYIWLIAAGIFFIIEMATVAFLAFWLGLGALLAMIVSFFTNNIAIQTSVFVIASSILILLTKPLVNKFMHTPNIPMNSASLIGKRGIAISAIDPIKGTGQVKIGGEIWSAKCDENTVIEESTEIEVLAIDGAKLLVSQLQIYINK